MQDIYSNMLTDLRDKLAIDQQAEFRLFHTQTSTLNITKFGCDYLL